MSVRGMSVEWKSKWRIAHRKFPLNCTYSLVNSETSYQLNRYETQNNDNHTKTDHQLLPGLIDAFENVRDLSLVALINGDLSKKRLLFELN